MDIEAQSSRCEDLSWEEAVLSLRNSGDSESLIEACYFDDPLIESAHRFYLSEEWCETRRYLQSVKDGIAIDVGAGRGIASYALAKEGYRVIAIEPDESDIVGSGAIKKLSSDANLSIDLLDSTGTSWNIKSNSVSVVYTRAVLHHVKDLEYLLSEIYRVLKPGGIFFAAREHVIDNALDLPIFLASHPLHHLYGGENAFQLTYYKTAIVKSGLELKAVLAPYSSEINLFPSTFTSLEKIVSEKLGFHLPAVMFRHIVIPLLNLVKRTPGRLYTFVGRKL